MSDTELLTRWQRHAHVRAWWEASAPYNPEDLADPRVNRCIVFTCGRPFAFIQDYTVHGWENHHFAKLPKGSRGIDQYIGDPDMIDAGHGTAFIGARMKTLFDQGAPAIATDPNPDNKRAIAVYRKLGFEISGQPTETQWGLILPMLAQR